MGWAAALAPLAGAARGEIDWEQRSRYNLAQQQEAEMRRQQMMNEQQRMQLEQIRGRMEQQKFLDEQQKRADLQQFIGTLDPQEQQYAKAMVASGAPSEAVTSVFKQRRANNMMLDVARQAALEPDPNKQMYYRQVMSYLQNGGDPDKAEQELAQFGQRTYPKQTVTKPGDEPITDKPTGNAMLDDFIRRNPDLVGMPKKFVEDKYRAAIKPSAPETTTLNEAVAAEADLNDLQAAGEKLLPKDPSIFNELSRVTTLTVGRWRGDADVQDYLQTRSAIIPHLRAVAGAARVNPKEIDAASDALLNANSYPALQRAVERANRMLQFSRETIQRNIASGHDPRVSAESLPPASPMESSGGPPDVSKWRSVTIDGRPMYIDPKGDLYEKLPGME